MNQPSQNNASRLESEQRSRERARRLALTLNVAVTGLLIILGAALIDYWRRLTTAERAIDTGLLAILMIVWLVRLIQFARRPATLKQVALEIEAQRPELGCVVSTASEYLSGERQPSQAYEPELVEALQEQAARRLLQVETRHYRKLVYSGSAMAAVLVALLVFLVVSPGSLTALERVILPWSKQTYTHVSVKPGNLEIPVGNDQEIHAVFTGVMPDAPQLRWLEDTGKSWQAMELIKDTNNSYSARLKSVQGVIKYQVTGNDAVSPEYTVQTYVPPTVKDLAIRVRFPAYTHLEPVEERKSDLSVVRASELTFRITSSEHVAHARLHLANAAGIELVPAGKDLWTVSLTPTNDLDYRVELTDVAGRKGGDESPRHLKVLPDEPPKVEITDPGMDVRADATNHVPVKISVTDDFGVADIKLIFRKLNGDEQTIVCVKTNSDLRNATATAEIDLAPLHLKEYEVVAYHAEARDNNTLDGPGVGKSPVYFIEYTTKSEPLSQSQGSAQKINLLQLEKQIIAATTAIEEGSTRDRFPEVATIQRQTKSYAEIYQKSYVLSISPPEARTEFAAAIASMDSAAGSLDGLQRPAALRAEDEALEHLYQVTRLLPELEACMCHGSGTKVVLEAVEKLKDDQKKKRETDLPKIVSQAKAIAQQQAKLADIYRLSKNEQKSGTNSAAKIGSGTQPAGTNNASKPGNGTGQSATASATPSNGQSTNDPASQEQNSTNGLASHGQGSTNGLASHGQGSTNDLASHGQDSTNQNPSAAENPEAAAGLSKEQQQLSEAAAALAVRLRELSGKDPRIRSGISRQMENVSQQQATAAGQIARGNGDSAAQSADAALSGLNGTITELEQLLDDKVKATDMTTEDYPKEFEPLISEYLRRLSYTK